MRLLYSGYARRKYLGFNPRKTPTMCGIAGFNLSADESVDPTRLAKALLLGIEERGRHATGVAYFDGHTPTVAKAAVEASRFVKDMTLPADAGNVILHTRWATKGSPNVNANNHPIDVNGIIGVHNGMVWNDDELFNRIGAGKRIAEVDSEAIFATLQHGREKPMHALGRVEGSAAVAWLQSYGDPEVLHVSRVSSSPLVYGFTEAGSFVFASTEQALRRAVVSAGVSIVGGPYTMSEGVYVQVRAGEVVFKAAYDTVDRRFELSAVERQALSM